MHYLGIDYGLKRIGIAYSQGDIAEPIGTYTAETLKQKLDLVSRLIDEYTVDTVILGKTTGTLAAPLASFKKSLTGLFNGKIDEVDESLTSRQAQQGLIAAGTTKSKRKKNLDAYAAVLILQTYLDEQQTH